MMHLAEIYWSKCYDVASKLKSQLCHSSVRYSALA